MEVVYVLVPLALLMSILGIALFSWALRHDQFEDLEGPRWRALYDEDQRQ
ncbi:MAG: cbb3-type cytochrome oxidase assembly protein CcoS [Candidatus Xenobia bacterium]